MKSKKHELPSAPRHVTPSKKKAMEMAAQAEHETGPRRENLIKQASRKAH